MSATPLTAGMKIGIDFGPTLTANWNNIVTLNQGVAAGSVTNLGGTVVDGVSIATANAQFINNDGTDNWVGLAVKGGNVPPEFVDSVVTDIAGNSSLGDGSPYKITLGGLDPALVYTVVAVATATGSPTDTFTVKGAATYGPSAIARASARTGLFHTFTNVSPTTAGGLVIEVMDSSAGSNPIVNGILITASATGNPDSDGDGLPDAWEQEHFGMLSQGAAGDYDQDGDSNLAEYQNGTLPEDIGSHSAVLQAWQIDFQGGTGGALGSANPVTSTFDIGYGAKWNAFEIAATDGNVFANPPAHNAAIDPQLLKLHDAKDATTKVDMKISGGVSGFNVGRVLDLGGINAAFGDHWFWGAQGRTTMNVGFTFSHLLPGTYSLTAYANPDQHNPPRDFSLTVGGTTVPISPTFGTTFYANAGTFAGTVRNITVGADGTLTGNLGTIGGDPSIAAMVLRRVSAPATAVAGNDEAAVGAGGKVRIAVIENDAIHEPFVSMEIVAPPVSGTALVKADHSILYAAGAAAGADSFTYRFTDATGVSNTATVSIQVSAGRVSPDSVTLPLEPPQGTYSLEDAFANRGAFNFGTPTWMASIQGNTKRFFVSERTGVIWEIQDMSAATATRRVFVDLSAKLDLYTEMGVKSFAFHPQFESGSPYVYVTYNYESPSSGSTVGSVRLSRFTVMSNGTGVVDPASELILFEVDSRSQDHNLDSCKFGPDGYLYVGSGDERRPAENSQTITNMFWSSVIRIDVDRRAGNLEPNASTNPSLVIPADAGVARYKIPADNPYAAASGTVNYRGTSYAANAVRSEIYITGVRNPWTFSFDTVDGDPVLWLGDVGSDGSDSREEVNIFRKGDNGGWNYLEGDRYNSTPPAGVVLRAPEYFYARGSGAYQGASVIGGMMVHGGNYPTLDGKYLFGDWLNGHIWTLERGAAPGTPTVTRIAGLSGVVGFTTDPSNGDILVLSWNNQGGALFDQSGQVGKVFRLKSQIVSGSTFPGTLSGTGLFADLADMTPNPGLHFYEPNVTFWSDNARKSRWFALPGTTDKMTWSADGAFTFPTGALWVKHFELETTRGNPATRKRLETRVIVKNAGGVYGISYRWNEAGTEATLVGDGGDTFDVQVTDPALPAGQQASTQRWQIPSRTQCLTCHNAESGRVLGFDSRQLNRDDVPFDGISGNYLQRLSDAGYLQGLAVPPASLPRHHAANDTSVDIESRVRSYLAVNCSYCHADSAGLDLRASASLDATHLLNRPDQGQITITDPAVKRIVPGSTAHSSVLQRMMGAPGFNRMPPLASSVVDAEGVALVSDWILNTANSAPVFSIADGQVLVIAADALPGTVVADLHAVDADGRDSVTHEITGGNPGGVFAIDPVTGILSVVGDVSSLGSGLVQLTITASDHFAGNPKTATLTVLIDSSGVNDAPRFTSPLHYYLPTTLAAGERIGQVTASDPERSPVTLAVTGGTAAGRFLLDPAIGKLTRGTGALAVGDVWTLEVTATDGNNPPAGTAATITFHITAPETVSDVPPAGATFWNIDFQGDGSSTAAGQTTTPATTTRGGMTWNAFQVKAYSGDPSAMSVNPSMMLRTHDGTQTQVGFHIFTDNDPNTPIGSGVYGYSGRTGADNLTGDYLLLLNSSSANGPILHQWEITGLTPGWQYDLLIQGGYDNSTARGIAFTVDKDGDGDLADETPVYVQANANAVTNSCVIRSVVADANGRILGQSSRTPPAGQTWGESNWAGLQVRAAGGSPPVFTASGPFSIVENAAAASVVGDLAARDPEGTAVSFTINSGNGQGLFALNATTGRITTTGPLDYENGPVHVLEVAATDGSGASSFDTVVIYTLNLPDTNADFVTSWLTGVGGVFAGQSSEAVIGFNADPDHDGIPNAFERLFGTNPSAADVRSGLEVHSQLSGGSRSLWLDATVDAAASDELAFHAEVSDDCAHWTTLAGDPLVLSDVNGKRVLRFTDVTPWPREPATRFIRLRMNGDDHR
ncbi:cadherin domain-containing protein [Luteolibacter ambystomatis]|uniref:cadherin domain-containing protein n=1 Tax=Luteolibacter ambystomatis TaxID=2824561 RepID=UPI0036DF239B